jgi:hypothetical protein
MWICRTVGPPGRYRTGASVRLLVEGGRYRPVNFSGSMMFRGGAKTSISFAG